MSWVVRLIRWGSSWVAPVDVQRVETALTDNQVAVIQIQELDARNKQPKVVVADSLYGNHLCLAVFLLVTTVVGLVRVRGNSVFYERPKPRQKGQRGAPAKQGARFKLSTPSRPADRSETFLLGQQTVVLTAWHGLHLKKLPALVGLVLRVQFLRADGTPRYQRPMWLFWTGPESVALKDLCCMYLWRFAIEHFFRFAKQHLGMNTNQSTQTVSTDHWMWLRALAFWQLLLMREGVDGTAPAWYPQAAKREAAYRTPGQVQRAAFGYLVKLGSPAHSPRPAGKGNGRAKGVQPTPRKRFPIVSKAKTALDLASAGP